MVSKSLKINQSNVVGFSPDGLKCFTLARDIHLWDIEKGRKLWRSHPFSHPSDAVFSPNGQLLAVKNTAGCIVTLAMETGSVEGDCSVAAEGEGSNLLFSGCGEFLVDGSWDGMLSVRRVDSGAIEKRIEFVGEMIRHIHFAKVASAWIVQHSPKAIDRDKPPSDGYFTLHTGSVPDKSFTRLDIQFPFIRSSSLSKDGKRLAVLYGAPPQYLHVYELPSEKLLWEDNVQIGGGGASLCWSSTGRFLASIQRDGMVHYDGANGKRLTERPLAFPSDVDYSPNERMMALGSWKSGEIIPLPQ